MEYFEEHDEELVNWLAEALFGGRQDTIDTEIVGEYIIDTCHTIDCGWETAIRKGSGDWIIVSRYENKEKAEKGHGIWAAMCTINPTKVWSVQTRKYEEF